MPPGRNPGPEESETPASWLILTVDMDNTVNDIIILLCKGIANRKLYFAKHPKVRGYAEVFVKQLSGYFKANGKKEFFIGVVDSHFIFDGQRLFGPTVVGRQLIVFLEMLRCGGVSFTDAVTVDAVSRFMDLTDGVKQPLPSLADARELFIKEGIENITLTGHYSDQPGIGGVDGKKPWEGEETGGFLQSPTLIYQAMFDVVTRAHGDATFDRELDIDSARSVSEFMLRFTQANFADVMQYIHYPDYDSYTVGHSVRVSSIAVYMGMQLNWPEEDILALATAAILHDIGKSKVAPEILYKTSALSQEEFGLIKDHPRIGTELLLAQKDASPLDVAAAWGHHQRHDGRGYPLRPAWAASNPVIELLQIIDVFEALTAIRPYKMALAPQQAFSIMINDKGAFHPGLLSTFMAQISIYPPGTYVTLSDGNIGMVAAVGARLDRPRVRIAKTKSGTVLAKHSQYEVDLGSIAPGSLYITNLLLNYLNE